MLPVEGAMDPPPALDVPVVLLGEAQPPSQTSGEEDVPDDGDGRDDSSPEILEGMAVRHSHGLRQTHALQRSPRVVFDILPRRLQLLTPN